MSISWMVEALWSFDHKVCMEIQNGITFDTMLQIDSFFLQNAPHVQGISNWHHLTQLSKLSFKELWSKITLFHISSKDGIMLKIKIHKESRQGFNSACFMDHIWVKISHCHAWERLVCSLFHTCGKWRKSPPFIFGLRCKQINTQSLTIGWFWVNSKPCMGLYTWIMALWASFAFFHFAS